MRAQMERCQEALASDGRRDICHAARQLPHAQPARVPSWWYPTRPSPAEIFFAVYEMSIDTIILAFCEDCDANDGHPKYAPDLLMEVMGGPKDDGAKPEKA